MHRSCAVFWTNGVACSEAFPLMSRQLPLAINEARPATLDNFVEGDNGATLALVRQWSQASHPVPPLFLWGPQASGKTHLLQGLAADVYGRQLSDPSNPRASETAKGHVDGPMGKFLTWADAVGWFTPQTPPPWECRPQWALVVVDGCDGLDAAAQHAAFVLFTEALTHGVPFAAAGTLPPSELPLRDDLRTRLAWGPVFALHPLREADTRLVLAAEARRRGLQLPNEVENYLLSRFPRDLGSLMQLLADLDAHGIATQRRLTVPLVRSLVAQAN
jgi:DnaA-homolog protein